MQSSKRILLNTVAQYAKTIINIALSLYSTRLVLYLLGESDYGIYTLVAGVVSMLSFLINALVNTTQRFLSFNQGKLNIEKVKEVFSNSLLLHIIIGLFFALFFVCISPFLFNGFLNIPIERLDSAKLVYFQVVIMVLTAFIVAPFRALCVSHENIVFTSIVEVIDGVFKVIFVLFLFHIQSDYLIAYGWIMLLIQVINFIAYLIYCSKKYEECIIPRIQYFKKKFLMELFSYAGWTVYDTACIVGRTQGLSIVLNRMMGTIINAAYGIGFSIAGYVSFVSSSLGLAINPQLVRSEGENNRERMWHLAMLQSKYSFLLLAMLSIPAMFEMQSLLSLWLGVVPDNAVLFCNMVLLAMLVDQVTTGLSSANRAIGKIGLYTFVITTPKLMTVPISWLLLRYDYPLYYIAIVYITIELISALLRLPLMKKIAGLNTKEYCKKVISKVIIPALFGVVICIIITQYIQIQYRFLITFLSSLISFFLSTYLFSMTSNEKMHIKHLIINSIFKSKL